MLGGCHGDLLEDGPGEVERGACLGGSPGALVETRGERGETPGPGTMARGAGPPGNGVDPVGQRRGRLRAPAVGEPEHPGGARHLGVGALGDAQCLGLGQHPATLGGTAGFSQRNRGGGQRARRVVRLSALHVGGGRRPIERNRQLRLGGSTGEIAFDEHRRSERERHLPLGHARPGPSSARRAAGRSPTTTNRLAAFTNAAASSAAAPSRPSSRTARSLAARASP